jgi:Glycosyltransferase family 28 C-terminal domain
VIGYYVHHQGRGHLHRAVAIASFAATDITGLSTHPRPSGWLGDWVELDDDAGAGPEADPSARGRLHYAPYAHDGLRSRMAALATWIANARPDALVVDVSVEVALLARLHGVPVLTMAQPGRRRDTAHTLGYAISDQILAPWPAAATQIWNANGAAVAGKVHHLGAISRCPVVDEALEPTPGSVLVLNGTGGRQLTREVDQARVATPAWDWVHLGGPGGPWSDDPWPLLRTASVVVSHCGQSAVADIAAARRPAVLIPQARPFREQATMAVALRRLGVPALVLDEWPAPQAWPALLEAAEALDGGGWSVWSDGGGAARAAEVFERAAAGASRTLA